MCAVRQNSIYWKRRPFTSALPCIRIDSATEFDPQRGPPQPELLAKPSLQVAPVTIGHVPQGIAVNHDQGRIGATLVRIPQSGAHVAGARRLLPFNSGPQRPGQLTRGQAADLRL